MSDLISVIVPIYKVENYLEACVDSIRAQTYKNLEIILVDDGSPDRCPEICDTYAQKDPRIRAIHKKNGGLSDARNVGMVAAKGAYLMFVDSDDWIEPDSIERLYDQIVVHSADMAIGCTKKFDDVTGEVLFCNYRGDRKTSVVGKHEMMKEDLRGGGWSACGKLYVSSVHQDIPFPIGETNEDEAIALRIIDRCKKIIKVDTLVYNYRARPDSICTSSFTESNLDWYKHCQADVQWIEEHHPELLELAQQKLYSCILLHLAEIAVAPKKYQHLALPLIRQVHTHYDQMKAYLLGSGRSISRLWIYRHLPYSLYCFAAKTWRWIRYTGHF